MTSALAKFGCYTQPSVEELDLLVLANDFRQEICNTHIQEHEATIEFRNRNWPDLFLALAEWECRKATVYRLEKAGELRQDGSVVEPATTGDEVAHDRPGPRSRQRARKSIKKSEREINQLHSDVRDRNARTPQQEKELKAARKAVKRAASLVTKERKKFNKFLKDYWTAWKAIADWQNVKSLSERQRLYAQITWSDPLQTEFFNLISPFDLRRRELGVEYQRAGLNSGTRGEINESSEPKKGKDKPGIWYKYRKPADQDKPFPVRPWTKLSLAFAPSGISVQDILDGRSKMLRLRPLYTNNKASGSETVYECQQQVGTRNEPCMVTYVFKAHRPLLPDMIIRRWARSIPQISDTQPTVVDEDRGVSSNPKGFVIPTIQNPGIVKHTGYGCLRYFLSWSVMPDGRLRVAEFESSRINETLYLPAWLVQRRMCVPVVQQEVDTNANEFLEQERGVPASKTPGNNTQFGLSALVEWCENNPDDTAAVNRCDWLLSRISQVRNAQSRAVRAIEKIYETVARRVCSLHSHVMEYDLDLAKLKRYKTRDLLKDDVVPKKSREYMHAASVGKLKAKINGWGLDVVPKKSTIPPEFTDPSGALLVTSATDVFTSFVSSLHVKTGPQPSGGRYREVHTDASHVAQEDLQSA